MAINATLVGKGTTTGTSLTTASGNTSASGSTFVYLVSYDATVTANTPTDNKGNTYVQKSTTLASGTGDKVAVWVCENGTGGTGHTATQTFSGAAFAPGYLVEITGATTTPTDIATNGIDAATPFTIATGTLAQANELVLTICMNNQSVSGTNTYSSSNTTILSQEANGAQFWTSAVSAQVVSSTASFSPSFTDTQGTAAALIVLTFKQAAASGTTLTCANGSFSLTGQVENSGIATSAANGSYSLTGQAATLGSGAVLALANGSYSLTGQSATLTGGTNDFTLLAGAGSFSLVGAGSASDLETPLDFGSFSWTGNAATLAAGGGGILTASSGSFALTGQTATLATGGGTTLTAVSGNYTLTGQALNSDISLPLAAGSLALTGVAAGLGITTSLAAGSYALSGQAATFSQSNPVLTADFGSFGLLGQSIVIGQPGLGAGPVDSPRIAEGAWRRKKKKRAIEQITEPAKPAAPEIVISAITAIPELPKATSTISLAEAVSQWNAPLDESIDVPTELERDDQEALRVIFAALGL